MTKKVTKKITKKVAKKAEKKQPVKKEAQKAKKRGRATIFKKSAFKNVFSREKEGPGKEKGRKKDHHCSKTEGRS